MKHVIDELSALVVDYEMAFAKISESDLIEKPSPLKWSKKQIIGHLIDSAHNNYRRFLSTQYEKTPSIWYDQNFWVDQNDYQQMKSKDLIQLWRLMNERIISVLGNMDASHYARQVDTGRTTPDLNSLVFIAEDYVRHLKHHYKQIFPE